MQQSIRAAGEREHAYFAASNSRYGFHSYYEQVFRGRVDRLFCIKGGPGTGKSTLMRAVAREGERRGMRVEYYYCSSDAGSLDAVLLFGRDRSLGLIDATSPHAFEPTLPGVREDILDLGRFWNAEMLSKHAATIVALNHQKSDGYRHAYRYLASIGALSDNVHELIAPCVDEDKLRRCCTRLLRDTPKGQSGQERIGLCSSIGMRGVVQLDTYWRQPTRVCLIEDYHDSAYTLTEQLLRSAAEQGMGRRVSYHPILPDRVDALELTDTATAFVVCSPEQTATIAAHLPHARTLNMRRMLKQNELRGVREQLRRLDRLRQGLLDSTCLCMQKVADSHFALEQLYIDAMDFSAKEQYTKALCAKLFD